MLARAPEPLSVHALLQGHGAAPVVTVVRQGVLLLSARGTWGGRLLLCVPRFDRTFPPAPALSKTRTNREVQAQLRRQARQAKGRTAARRGGASATVCSHGERRRTSRDAISAIILQRGRDA